MIVCIKDPEPKKGKRSPLGFLWFAAGGFEVKDLGFGVWSWEFKVEGSSSGVGVVA